MGIEYFYPTVNKYHRKMLYVELVVIELRYSFSSNFF